jgi:POT family proton-dependent oligopeptide transporter
MFFIPILDRIVFPWFHRHGIPFSITARITCGFILCSGAVAYAAIVQKAIYSSPPCYSFPRALDCMDGKVPNEVHVLVQIPGYVLLALSEILISVTSLEHAYTHAPQSMRSFIMSLFISTYAVGSLLALAITPFTFDPNIVNVYSFLSLITFIVGLLFWFKNRHFEVAMHGHAPIQCT